MSVREKTIQDLVNTVQDTIGDGANETTLDRQREAFVQMVEQRRGIHQRRKRMFATAIGVAAVLLLSVAFLYTGSPDALSFVVGESGVPGGPGTFVSSTGNKPTEIRFSQGTRILVGEDSAARMVQVDQESVQVELSRGMLSAAVQGNARTRWVVHAGPFSVSVLGTRFDVNWDASGGRLQVVVHEGLVLVQGGELETHGVTLMAGRTLTADTHRQTWQLSPLSEMRSVDASGGETIEVMPAELIDDARTTEEAMTEDNARRVPEADRDSPRRDVGAIREVERRGIQSDPCQQKDYAACIGAARDQGWDTVLSNGTADELWRLSESARMIGQTALSNEILSALRKRFAGSSKAKLSAFVIGRTLMDASGDHAAALKWFGTYLQESPQGPMAEESYGRIITSSLRIGQTGRARQAAQVYLERFPDGLYARRAQQVLAGP